MNQQEFAALTQAAKYLEDRAAKIREDHRYMEKVPSLILDAIVDLTSAASVTRCEIAFHDNKMKKENP